MSFQQLNRALRTDEENIKEQLNRINSMLKGQQFGPQGGRLSLDVTFSPIDRQFETTLSRILSKLEDWTRNASDNPTETRKAFNNCETFVNRLHNELDKIHDTNGIKAYGARNLDPRVRAHSTQSCTTTTPPTNASALPAENPAEPSKNSPHSSTAQPSSTSSAATSPHAPPTPRSSSTKHSSKPTAATPNARSPYYPDSASKSSSPPRKAKPRKSSTSPTEHTSHTKTHPPATHTYRNSTRNHHTGRNTAHHRTRETNNGGITHGNGQKHHQQRHPQPTQRIRHRLSHQAHV